MHVSVLAMSSEQGFNIAILMGTFSLCQNEEVVLVFLRALRALRGDKSVSGLLSFVSCPTFVAEEKISA